MTTDWIREFQHIITSINERFQALAPSWDGRFQPDEMEHGLSEALSRILIEIAEWSQTLSDRDTLQTWIETCATEDSNLDWLSTSWKMFDGLLVMMRERRADDPALPLLSTLSDEMRYALDSLEHYSLGQPQPWISPASPFQTIRPDAMLTGVVGDLEDGVKMLPMPSDVATWPDVLFHPYYTTGLLHRLINRLNRSRIDPVRVSVARSPHSLQIILARRAMCLTPVLWRDLLLSLQDVDGDYSLELLREMGGSIEPLVWNNGQGEGVIVQLPWATS